jgi:hypothetical protein
MGSRLTGVWTDVTAAGSHPSARAQHGMVYEKSTKKILLFGGGRSDGRILRRHGDLVFIRRHLGIGSNDARLDAVAQANGTPSARHDFGLVWDSTRNVAVLFAGMQIDIQGASGVPKRDIWELESHDEPRGPSEPPREASPASAMAMPWPSTAAAARSLCSVAGT